MRICIIPARGGSKRIPRKNIRDFCGKPMIAWSIEAAEISRCFDRIVVSTDDEEIAETSLKLGAEVPFMRPPSLADDHTATVPVIADAVERLELDHKTPVCCLYATAPFVMPEDLQEGQRLLETSNVPFVLTVTTFSFPIQRALRRDTSGIVEMLDPSLMQTRSQDLEEAWHDAGQSYWAHTTTWKSGSGLFENGAYGLPLPRHRVQDIDTAEDWARAELMMQAMTLNAREAPND